MSPSWFRVAVVALVLLSPAVAMARAVSFSDAVRARDSGPFAEPDAGYWQKIAADQEAAQSCESREPGRLVIRHPPIAESATPRQTCHATVVIEALREQKPVELENVVISGTLDLRDATTPALQRELRLRGRRLGLLQGWLDERRRDHRAPDLLPGQTRFRAIAVPIVIRNSRIDAVKASAEDPMLFTEPLDLRGTRIGGPVSIAGAIFMEPVTLEDVEFSEDVALTGTHFDAGLDLSRASVRGAAKLDGATFGTRALSRPAGRARLAETPALFIGATFAKPVTFRDAVFEARADFRKASFAGETELAAARFYRVADFGHATFRAPVDAANAIFEDDARFPSAVFDKPVTFRGAQFRGYADFALATFTDSASTFRNAQFGPALFVPRTAADARTALRRFWHTAGYDFRETKFADKARTLARADFQVHGAFSVVTIAAAVLGLMVALAMRRPPLIEWSRSDAPDSVAQIREVEPRRRRAGAWRGPASPRERLADGAYLIAAYGVLAVALASHYQTHAANAIDRPTIWIYPTVGVLAWAAAVVAALNPFRLGSAQRLAAQAPAAQTPALDYFDPAYHVPRRCDDFVHNFVTRVSTGVLGLAGPRGAGRSALARAVLDALTRPGSPRPAEPAPILAVTMPSPPAGDLMSFFTVLFRRVGQQVQRELRGRLFTYERAGHAIERAAEELIQPPPAVTLLPLAVVAASLLFFLSSPWWSPAPTGGPGDWTPWVLIAGLGACAVVYYGFVMRLMKLRRALREVPSGRLYVHTERALERLAYEESTTEEREASVALPRGISFRGRRARALKERATTLATMVDDFARYVAALRHIFSRGVVVHIDDADRTEKLEDVRDLVLRLKGTLVGGVLFLVPLPHVVLDAAADGPSTAVAGMLDDVVMVPPMTFDEALRMLARRRFFATDDPGAPDRLQARDGLGAAICLIAGGIPKEILRLLRRVSTEARDWTARTLVDLSARDGRESVRRAVLHAATPAAVKQRVLDAIDRGDDGTSVEAAASADPAATDAALLDVLRRFDRRREALLALRARLDELKVLEGEIVAAIAANTPIGPLDPWLEQLHRAFVAVQTGIGVGGAAA